MTTTTTTLDWTMTASRRSALMECPRKHQWRYECGIVPDRTAPPLRFGTLWHMALELYAKGVPADLLYSRLHEAIDEANYYTDDERELERCTIINMLAGYLWCYPMTGIQSMHLLMLATEEEFCLPLYDSDGLPTGWKLAGKIDARVMAEGREMVLERKTTSDDLAADSPYWQRLRMDSQPSIYLLSCRMIGSKADTVLYDVARKPTISQVQVPLLDDDGNKVVLDANGNRVMNKNGYPRQTSDAKKGYTLQTRLETPKEFGSRLLADIQVRPMYYFARQEITRLEADLEDAMADVLATVRLVEHYRAAGYWPRNSASCNRFGRCAYWALCAGGYAAGEPLPEGFRNNERIHAELSLGEE